MIVADLKKNAKFCFEGRRKIYVVVTPYNPAWGYLEYYNPYTDKNYKTFKWSKAVWLPNYLK